MISVSQRIRFSSSEARQQSLDRISKESFQREKLFTKYGVVNLVTDTSRKNPEPKITIISGVKRNKIITRRRSPHVNKKHRDQFQMSKGNTSLVVFKGERKKDALKNSIALIGKLQEDLNNKRVGMIKKRNLDIESRLLVEKMYSEKKVEMKSNKKVTTKKSK